MPHGECSVLELFPSKGAEPFGARESLDIGAGGIQVGNVQRKGDGGDHAAIVDAVDETVIPRWSGVPRMRRV